MKCVLLFMRPEPAMTPRKTVWRELQESAEADDITVPAQCVIYRQSSTLVHVCVCAGV